jgi:hypothetical protein
MATAAPASPTASPAPTAGAVIQEVLSPGDPLEEELTAAYREYWRVYADALYSLDTSQLPTVAAGAELDRITVRIQGLRDQGEAVRVNVDHVTSVLRISGSDTDVAVRDSYTDRSYAIDAITKEPRTSGDGAAGGELQLAKGQQQDHVYFFKRIDGSWKVTQAFVVAVQNP